MGLFWERKKMLLIIMSRQQPYINVSWPGLQSPFLWGPTCCYPVTFDFIFILLSPSVSLSSPILLGYTAVLTDSLPCQTWCSSSRELHSFTVWTRSRFKHHLLGLFWPFYVNSIPLPLTPILAGLLNLFSFSSWHLSSSDILVSLCIVLSLSTTMNIPWSLEIALFIFF